jgi:hypothetical protein
MKTNHLLISLLVSAGIFISPKYIYSQSASSQLESAAGRKIESVYVPTPSAPVPVSNSSNSSSFSTSSSSGSNTEKSTSTTISNALTNGIIQGVISNLLNSEPDQTTLDARKKEQERIDAENEKQRQIDAAFEQERHDNMMKMLKPVSGSQTLEVKTLQSGNTDLDVKTLNGGNEDLSGMAANQFDSLAVDKESPAIGKGNDFFGIPVSSPDLQILIIPENDPVYIDTKTAVNLTDEYLKNENLSVKTIEKPADKTRDVPVIEQPACKALNDKLVRYRTDMIKFQAWNTETLAELDKWNKQNDDAFWNAVKDGASAAFGVFVDYLNDSRTSASKIKKILDENEETYIKDKIFTKEAITKYKKLLDQRISLCEITELVKTGMEPWDYVNLARNILQGTVENLAKSDGDCMEIINVLKEKQYLGETPFVDAGQFLASEAIKKFLDDPGLVIKPGSLIKGSMKIPYVTIVQLAIDETYNAADWLTSRSNICKLREADGKATEAVNKIQADMDDIKLQLVNCPPTK